MAQGMQRILVLGSQARALINFRGTLVRDLVEQGHDVTVAAPELLDAHAATIRGFEAKPRSIDLARTGMNPVGDVAAFMRLRRLVREERIDLVLSSTIKPNIWGAFAARAEGARSIAMVTGLGYAFTPLETGSVAARAKQRAAHLAASTLYRAATGLNERVVFQNPDDAAEFVASGCLADPSKIVLTDGSGVDVDLFAPAPLPDAPRVLMVSRLLGNKGVREYAEAAAQVRASNPNTRFELVGATDEGPDGVSVENVARWSQGAVDYRGATDDVRPAIAAANVCVLPSYREGTPRALLEGMAMGRAIVASDAPGCRETVEEGRNGHLVPVRDAAALAVRLRRLVADAAERARMGVESRAMAVDRYDVRRVNERLLGNLGLAANGALAA